MPSQTDPKELLLKVAPRIPLFYGLGIGVLEDFIRCSSLISIKEGEKLANEGDKADSFFVILSGAAVVQKRVKKENVMIAVLGSGDCVGEMSLISPEPRSASVIATKDSLVLKVYDFKLKMFPGLVSELYLNIARILERRLRKNNHVLASLTVGSSEGDEVAEPEVSREDNDSNQEASSENASAAGVTHDTSDALFMRTEGDLKPP
jgi:CRP-like cAMP-binding protein